MFITGQHQSPSMLLLQIISKLSRMADCFIEGNDRKTILDSLTKLRFIQELPKDTMQFVQERQPETAARAGILAVEHFAAQERDFYNWDSSKSDGKAGDKPYTRDKQEVDPGRRTSLHQQTRTVKTPAGTRSLSRKVKGQSRSSIRTKSVQLVEGLDT